ncbi:magnesium and cobalt transport protein CorA [Actinoalloteichus hymeniacidonis]|uniref:Mg2+/Co2+ transporter n=1 Tax=Actinoalloteichus hymeniacidonis TaxID=340345 RepID=A0AAC9HMD4_9PSEU|nr:magnesium and cobalt transport protein CorA [Actinoalloteichus hymeniacidonis]AOS61773.1 Mg2+/Co2+ transporter [Actinoalloteichus hymeniacidonis]MBB5910208.1 magnesium transporter [Actinoalloteichus hymeniacidonis]
MAVLPSRILRNRSTRSPASRPAQAERSEVNSVVDCAVYVDGGRLPGHRTHGEALAEVRRRGTGFVWIGLHEPTENDIKGIAETFDLHELAVEDAVHAHQRPKLERYGDTLFMVLKTIRYLAEADPRQTGEVVESGEMMVFLGRDFVLTVRHGNHSGLAGVRRQLEADPEHLALGPAVVLHAIADQVVDSYLAVGAVLETAIDEMEARVFAPKTTVDAEQIYLLKREVLELRRAVKPLGTPLRRLADGYSAVVPEKVRSYFRDVEDHLTKVSEQVAGFDELLTTLVDAALAKITLRQSSDMRKITSWAAIISVPTMVAGIYGMNFDYIPELHYQYSYPVVLLVILGSCLTLYRTFRRNGWL